MARPTKYCQRVVNALSSAIATGAPIRHACAAAGIGESTFYDWQATKPEFAEIIKKAEAKGVISRLATIREAEQQHWQAAAWWLERRYPEDFGRLNQEQRVQHAGRLTILNHELSALNDVELEQLAALAAKMETGEGSA